MAKQGGARGRKTVPARGTKRPLGAGSKKAQPQKRPQKQPTVVFDAAVPMEESRTFRLGVVPGATPGKWIDAWKQRMPQVPLELIPIEAAGQREALGDLDAALMRLPLEDDTLHIITLYVETPVVVAAVDSHLMAVDELSAADLAGEVLIRPEDDVLATLDLPGTLAPSFPSLSTTEEAIVTVATGVGIVVVPMSLARLHHRKDVGHRPLLDGPTSTVALVWPRERTTADVETFVGIVRGRTQNSSR
ncbi:LysR family transcriptional regulator substrate-binding protein [Microbacterium sp. LWH12-1.2]|uniref:LysR family transcriptional regulator substrate-binding protein n=1 Tax=Microbacterium sp. LWH12-1.2 TaxID=3135259 RepID=UPI003447292F